VQENNQVPDLAKPPSGSKLTRTPVVARLASWLGRIVGTPADQEQPELPAHRERPAKLRFSTEFWLRNPWATLSEDDILMLWSANYLSFETDTSKDISRISIIRHQRPAFHLPVPSIVSPAGPGIVAEAFLPLPKMPGRLCTALDFLRPGDGIRLHWFRDALNNFILDDAQLHGDMLTLHVIRDEWLHEFDLHYVVGRNDKERLIRPASKRVTNLKLIVRD
jgi:hypothetical protein